MYIASLLLSFIIVGRETTGNNQTRPKWKAKIRISALMKTCCNRYAFLFVQTCRCKYRETRENKPPKVTLGWSEKSSGMQLLVHWDWRWTRTAICGQAGHNSYADLVLSILIPASLLREPFQVSATKHFPNYGVCILIWILQLKPTCGYTVRQKSQQPRATPSHWLWSRNGYYPAISITKHPVC